MKFLRLIYIILGHQFVLIYSSINLDSIDKISQLDSIKSDFTYQTTNVTNDLNKSENLMERFKVNERNLQKVTGTNEYNFESGDKVEVTNKTEVMKESVPNVRDYGEIVTENLNPKSGYEVESNLILKNESELIDEMKLRNEVRSRNEFKSKSRSKDQLKLKNRYKFEDLLIEPKEISELSDRIRLKENNPDSKSIHRKKKACRIIENLYPDKVCSHLFLGSHKSGPSFICDRNDPRLRIPQTYNFYQDSFEYPKPTQVYLNPHTSQIDRRFQINSITSTIQDPQKFVVPHNNQISLIQAKDQDPWYYNEHQQISEPQTIQEVSKLWYFNEPTQSSPVLIKIQLQTPNGSNQGTGFYSSQNSPAADILQDIQIDYPQNSPSIYVQNPLVNYEYLQHYNMKLPKPDHPLIIGPAYQPSGSATYNQESPSQIPQNSWQQNIVPCPSNQVRASSVSGHDQKISSLASSNFNNENSQTHQPSMPRTYPLDEFPPVLPLTSQKPKSGPLTRILDWSQHSKTSEIPAPAKNTSTSHSSKVQTAS